MKKILLVDDSTFILAALENKINEQINEITLLKAQSYEETRLLLEQHKFYAAVVDVNLPDAEKGETIDLVNTFGIPVIVLTGTMNEEIKEVILKKDIYEFVSKNEPGNILYVAAILKRILNNYTTNVLIVDDSKMARTYVRHYLEKLNLNVYEVDCADSALEFLDENKVSVSLILTDYEMPGMNGMDFTMRLRETYSKDKLGVIAISSNYNIELVTRFLKHGANEFLTKPFSSEEFSVRVNSTLELLQLFKETRELANKDFLTGSYNRRYFFESGSAIFKKAKRKNKSLAVAMFDIDHFKKINDTYGHDIGDIAIKNIATTLQNSLRGSDLLARFGGEEFCALLEDITKEDAIELFEKIRNSFESSTITVGDISFSYTVSVGICYGLEKNLDEMIKKSDEGLYIAKQNGRNKTIINGKVI